MRHAPSNIQYHPLKNISVLNPYAYLHYCALIVARHFALYFLKEAGSLKMVPKALSEDPAIDHALRIANKAALSPEELDRDLPAWTKIFDEYFQ